MAGNVSRDDVIEISPVEEYGQVCEAANVLNENSLTLQMFESCESTNQVIETDVNETETITTCPFLVSGRS